MSVRTKKHRIKKAKEKSVPWREVFKKDIKKYGEAALALSSSRHKKDMTQQELADKLGMSQHHISEMENGKRTIGKAMAKRFSEIFDVDYKVFL